MKKVVRIKAIILIICLLSIGLSPNEVAAAPILKYINVNSCEVIKGKTFTLKVFGFGGKKIKWSSSNKKAVVVSQTGTIKGVATGSSTIKATVSGRTYTCKVRVKVAPKNGWAENGIYQFYYQNGKPLKNTLRTIKGKFYVSKGGDNFTPVSQGQFYFGSNGVMVTNKRIKYNDVFYYAGVSGVLIKYMSVPAMKKKILKEFNECRKENGLDPIVEDPSMSNYAQDWSDIMAKEQKLYHSDGKYGELNFLADGYNKSDEFLEKKKNYEQEHPDANSYGVQYGEGCENKFPWQWNYTHQEIMYNHVQGCFNQPNLKGIGIGITIGKDGAIYETVNGYAFH